MILNFAKLIISLKFWIIICIINWKINLISYFKKFVFQFTCSDPYRDVYIVHPDYCFMHVTFRENC